MQTFGGLLQRISGAVDIMWHPDLSNRAEMAAAPVAAAPAATILGLSGSVRRPSRTTALVEAVAAAAARRHWIVVELHDLAGMGPGLGAFSRDELPAAARAVLHAMEQADALVVGSPIYKGSYAGLFKHLIDFLDPAALAGKPVALVATGGGRRHALAVEHQLRPLFGFFSALTLPTAVYASDEEFRDGVPHDEAVLARIEQASAELAAQLRVRDTLRPVQPSSGGQVRDAVWVAPQG